MPVLRIEFGQDAGEEQAEPVAAAADGPRRVERLECVECPERAGRKTRPGGRGVAAAGSKLPLGPDQEVGHARWREDGL